jgi:hypothetical protein
MSTADLQELSRLDVIEEAMEFTDPLAVNEAAFAAGALFSEARIAAADLEAGRTLLRFRIQQRLRDEGAASSDKAAEQLAKDDPEYVAHCAAVTERERERDRAEIAWKCLYQRAYLLSRGGTPAEGSI